MKIMISQEYHRSLDTGDEHLSRPSSALSKMFGHHHHFQPSNLIKGKSMPSLRLVSIRVLKKRVFIKKKHIA